MSITLNIKNQSYLHNVILNTLKFINPYLTYQINNNIYNLYTHQFNESDLNTYYNNMIDKAVYDDCLFIFNDNVESYVHTVNGGGNANIREYKKDLRCWGIPTGTSSPYKGFTALTEEIAHSGLVKNILDRSIQDIKAVIYHRRITRFPVKHIIYSAYHEKLISIDDKKIPTLAQSLFKIGDEVSEYIIKQLYDIYINLDNMSVRLITFCHEILIYLKIK